MSACAKRVGIDGPKMKCTVEISQTLALLFALSAALCRLLRIPSALLVTAIIFCMLKALGEAPLGNTQTCDASVAGRVGWVCLGFFPLVTEHNLTLVTDVVDGIDPILRSL